MLFYDSENQNMKKITYSIAILLFFAYALKAQPYMLGKKVSEIKAINLLPKGTGIFEEEGRQNDSTTYIQFVAKSDPQVHFRYYMNRIGICEYFVIMQPTSEMVSFILELNKDYIKIGDSEWINHSNDLRISLDYQKGDTVFTTWFSQIQ